MNFKKTWKRFFTLSRRSEGFTLVELIVVIAILAILAGVAVPAYSGYIKKANKAADLQLLGAVNTAFAAACMENGKDVRDIRNGGVNPRWHVAGEGRQLSGVTMYNEEFQKYFTGNTGVFKVINELIFINGAFVDPTTATEGVTAYTLGENGPTIYLSDADVQNIANSPWADTGLTDVDRATAILSNSADEDVEEVVELIWSDDNLNAISGFLGYDINSDQGQALIDRLATQLAEQEGVEMNTSHQDAALNTILSNGAVLAATSNSSFDATAFAAQMAASGNGAKESIKANLQEGGDMQTAMSQAAFTYAMYTSYMNHTNQEIPADLGLMDVVDIMDDDDFKSYIANDASADIAGYESAMNLINSSAQNQSAVADILINGFNTQDLNSLLNSITNTESQG